MLLTFLRVDLKLAEVVITGQRRVEEQEEEVHAFALVSLDHHRLGAAWQLFVESPICTTVSLGFKVDRRERKGFNES